ncbi:MAG: hypothetical protein KAU95_00675 [Candidatus Aenigmarchaeota archaeon]|nr:hypothetical protein [Candidatus Aenigmarchaeota archaeon]
MESKLELTLVFSSELDETLFNKMLKEMKNIAKKEFLNCIYKSNRMFMNLESDKELSKLVFKIVSRLSEFGRVYKLGVRDFYIPRYELGFECDFTGKVKIPIGICICNGETCKLVFTNLEKNFLRGGVSRTINLINSKIVKKEFLIASEIKKECVFNGDPVEEMKNNNLVVKGLVKEENFYLPEGAKLINNFKNKILPEFKNQFKAEEILIPSYIPINMLDNKDILEGIPQEIFSRTVGTLKDKNKVYEFYYLFGKVPKMNVENTGILFDELPLTLYKALENKIIDKKMFYYYNSNLKLVFAFFDKKEDYASLKKEIIDFLKAIVKSFDLRCRILTKKYKGELVRIQAYLPYKKSWLTIVDALFSGESYTKPYNIDGKSGKIVVYLENLLISDIAQKGYHSGSSEPEGEIEERSYSKKTAGKIEDYSNHKKSEENSKDHLNFKKSGEQTEDGLNSKKSEDLKSEDEATESKDEDVFEVRY